MTAYSEVIPSNATSEGLCDPPFVHDLDLCPCNRQRGDSSGLGAEDSVTERGRDPLRLFEALQLVRGPAALGTDRKRQRLHIVVRAKEFTECGFALGFGEDDAQ